MGRAYASGLLACLAACLIAPAAAPAATVDAGALRAVTTDDPWSLSLTDGGGAAVLDEDDGTGVGTVGTLGFRSLGIWRHATRVISQQTVGTALVAELETTDPLRTIEARIEPDAEGVIALEAKVLGPTTADVDALGIGFDAPAAERYLGFGERSNAVAQTGVVENYVSDGPYQTEEYPFINGFVPTWGIRERAESTYFPIPWLLSTAGYGVLVDNPETSYFRVRSDSASDWSVEVVRAPESELGGEAASNPDTLRLRFFAGPDPFDAVRRFTRETGRQPPPAPWLYGPWYQPGDLPGEIDALRAADAPVSVAQTYLHYLPCGAQQGVEGQQPALTGAAHDRGVAITTYFNPMVCESYSAAFDPAAAAGALARDGAGDPYLYDYGADPTERLRVGQYDFFRQAGRDQYALRLQEAIGHGYDGWMEDFGEYTPLDSVMGEAGAEIDGTRSHNPYVTRYHCAAFGAVQSAPRPIVRFQRSGWTGAAPCTTAVWGGDPTTGWGFDGLASAVTQSLNMGLSGISVWGTDIGGFFALGFNQLDGELLKRWVQFGALNGVMRTQRNGVALPPRDRPQVNDPDQIENWRRYAKLRTQLYPYLVAAQAEYADSGMPLMRHMALAFPGDPALVARDDQYLFGDDLLAAPVVTPGATTREVAVPGGTWIDLWRSVSYEPASGGLELGAAEVVPSGGAETLPAPLTEMPLLVRGGAVLPLLPPDVDTLADYGGPGITKLSDRADRLELIAFPRGDSSSDFYEDEELVSSEGDGRWTLEVDGSTERTYRLQASLNTLEQPFAACEVSLDGVPLAAGAWSHDLATGVLEASFPTTDGTLEVSACGVSVGGGPNPAGQDRIEPVPAGSRCGGADATIAGTNAPDRLKGSRKADVFVAGPGADLILGRGGNDIVCGGGGDDKLRGGAGDDVLRGGRGDDRLRGGGGTDRCRGGPGADVARHCERGRS